METIRLGSSGPLVRSWQEFLKDRSFYDDEVHGRFDAATKEASKAFQSAQGLVADGVVGPNTWAKAQTLGFTLANADWPAKPTNVVPASLQLRQQLFGAFKYVPAPVAGNPEGIHILGSWVKDNIVTITIPQLAGIPGAHPKGLVSFHRAAAPQLQAMFNAWEAEGLLPLVKTFGGTWAPRFIRGSTSSLSNHAWGTAIDLNAQWNGLKMRPASVGTTGSVRELVPIALEFGFYWGGWFGERPDGMHFECFDVLTVEELAAKT